MLGCMRTTLTLDPDVAAALARVRDRDQLTLKRAINDALRLGLRALEEPDPSHPVFTTASVSLGGCLVGSLDDIADVLAVSEGEGFR